MASWTLHAAGGCTSSALSLSAIGMEQLSLDPAVFAGYEHHKLAVALAIHVDDALEIVGPLAPGQGWLNKIWSALIWGKGATTSSSIADVTSIQLKTVSLWIRQNSPLPCKSIPWFGGDLPLLMLG